MFRWDCMSLKMQMTAIRIPLSDVHAQESHEAKGVTLSLALIKRKSKKLLRMGSFFTLIFIDFIQHGVQLTQQRI